MPGPIHIPIEFPVLQTERLTLKRIQKHHAGDLLVMRSDPKVMQFIQRPLASTVEDALELIGILDDGFEKRSAITWGVFNKGKDRLLGTAGYWRIQAENMRGEVGYLLHPDLWSKGMMTEVLMMIQQYAWDVINLHSIEARCNPDNEASIALLERLGYEKEGYFKENFLFEDRFYDTVVYSLLNR